MARFILLVDDSDDDAELTIRAFSEAGVVARIVRLRDGAQAIEYLLGGDANDLPEAILLDLRMPSVDGFGVLSAIQAEERTRQVPVIVMTTSGDDEDRLKAY
jgi:two-component system, response regulator